ncbi:MAG: efflux transporter outer membrane subunit [Burkholderiaceae bacterium]|jgi:NodT family efflux transporter outer membrane factor (OMF) lipoprotein|nr:efflux transporter outer membrane subunit [Burkholderiaceae bacterium]
MDLIFFTFGRCWKQALTVLLALGVAGCVVGPDYQRPMPPPGVDAPAFKESSMWTTARPAIATTDGLWWRAYGDSQLDALIDQANQANQTLAQAQAQYRQALALLQGARAAYYPQIGIGAAGTRARTIIDGVPALGNSHAWSLQASWEPDLWGGVRRKVEVAGDEAQASAADLAAARLAVQAAVVNSHMQLRLNDEQEALYASTIEGYQKALALTQAQHRAGVVTNADVALAENTLATARAEAVDLDLTRRQLEHALAVLLGKTPGAFSLPVAPLAATLPTTPPGLPSQLLERRPDIAAAERRVAAANAQIGVAKSAYFPSLTLSASGGYQGNGFGPWFLTPGRVWALGASLAETLFDGGARSAQVRQARAALDEAAASYRQTVLSAFQEVEDNLAALNDLASERLMQEEAARAAHEAARVLMAQYRAGTAPYTAVVTAQALALTADRAVLQSRARQFAASVALIKAVGGGWDVGQLADVAGSASSPLSTPNTSAKAQANSSNK